MGEHIVKFKCSECGCTDIEEVRSPAVQIAEIDDVFVDDDRPSMNVLYGRTRRSRDDSHIEIIRCGSCERQLAGSLSELEEFVKEAVRTGNDIYVY